MGWGASVAWPRGAWLCGLLEPPDDPDGPDMWRVLARDEISEVGTKWQIDRGDGEPELYDREAVYVTRIWQPHPRRGVHANSSVRSALPILRELVGLSKRQAAIIDSRLAGNGILAVPTEITFAAPTSGDPEEGEDAENDEQQDPFMASLIETMVAALENQGDASAVVPLVIKAPAEHLDKIKHITLSSMLDEKAIEQRKEIIGRLANSLDVPAEVLLGLADVNHWTGWLLDENAIKMHIEPILGTITRGLTTRYLWPVLQGKAERLDPALRRFRIIGDTSALRQRPNRSAEAGTAHAALTITNDAWARETGFETDDLLDPASEEFKQRVLVNLALRGTPEVAVAALDALGIVLDVPEPTPLPGATTAPAAPAVEQRDPRDLPEQSQAAALLAASEALVDRAVERGWNRAGRRGAVRRPVDEDRLDACLADVWGLVPRVAALTGVDAARLHGTLDTYARDLLRTGAEHDPHTLATWLMRRVISPPEALEAAA